MSNSLFEKLIISSESDAAVAGLAYAGLFNFCLDEEEVRRFAIGMKVDTQEWKEDERLVERDGVWCLRDQAELLDMHEQMKLIQEQKIAYSRKWSWALGAIPWVKLVAITGSVAGGSPGQDDDIDLLIITSGRRLWLSRLGLVLWLNVLGKRRKPHEDPGKVRDKFCLNMWLSEEELVEEQQSLYTANELVRIVPVVDREGMYGRYVEANVGWVAGFLPNSFASSSEASSVKGEASRGGVSGVRFLDWVDEGCRRMLMGVMRKRTQEVVGERVLKFHPVDHGGEILQRLDSRLTGLGLTKDL